MTERVWEDDRSFEVSGGGRSVEVYVSHGIDLDTDKCIPLPWEKWSNFWRNCVNYEGEWYLK